MKILNASKSSLNIMMDRGNIMSVAPGKISEDFVATLNVIQATINAGSPSEIGIILGGTWEQSIAQKISGGQPYYYCSEDEARARLIDPTVDYSNTMINAQNEDLKSELKKSNEQVESLRKIIAEKDNQIKDLNDKLSNSSQNEFTELELKKLTEIKSELEVANKKLTAELEGEKSNVTQINNQLNTVTAEKNALSERVSILTEASKSDKDTIIKLESKVAELKSKLEQPDPQVATLKEALEKSTNQIESMKATFNGVCDQFGIEYTEDGKWIQNKA